MRQQVPPARGQLSRYTRHLRWLSWSTPQPARSGAGATASAQDPFTFPPSETNWHDHAVMLLHIAAEIEHSLMVEYLFAAYTLGGQQVPQQHQVLVRRWQEVILGIAKEEMGHLITVQNVLTLLGAPINLSRQDYSWTIDFYPFRFTLERLAPDTLATFVCAESPAKWTQASAPLIRRLAKVEARHAVNRVGILYGLSLIHI